MGTVTTTKMITVYTKIELTRKVFEKIGHTCNVSVTANALFLGVPVLEDLGLSLISCDFDLSVTSLANLGLIGCCSDGLDLILS